MQYRLKNSHIDQWNSIEPRMSLMRIWTTDFPQRWQGVWTRKDISNKGYWCNWIPYAKSKLLPSPDSTVKFNSICFIVLNVRTKTIIVPEENKEKY